MKILVKFDTYINTMQEEHNNYCPLPVTFVEMP